MAIRALCSGDISSSVEIIKNDNCDKDGFRYSSTVLPVKSVGIKGDARCYSHPCVLESDYDFKKIKEKMTEITNNSTDINRVIYNVKSFGDIRHGFIHKQHLTKKYMDILRVADDIVMKALKKYNLMKKIWQCPTVIIPFGTETRPYSFVVRPIDSIDAMSAEVVNLGKDVLNEISINMEKDVKEMFALFYDFTSKPPGTIEWE